MPVIIKNYSLRLPWKAIYFLTVRYVCKYYILSNAAVSQPAATSTEYVMRVVVHKCLKTLIILLSQCRNRHESKKLQW